MEINNQIISLKEYCYSFPLDQSIFVKSTSIDDVFNLILNKLNKSIKITTENNTIKLENKEISIIYDFDKSNISLFNSNSKETSEKLKTFIVDINIISKIFKGNVALFNQLINENKYDIINNIFSFIIRFENYNQMKSKMKENTLDPQILDISKTLEIELSETYNIFLKNITNKICKDEKIEQKDKDIINLFYKNRVDMISKIRLTKIINFIYTTLKMESIFNNKDISQNYETKHISEILKKCIILLEILPSNLNDKIEDNDKIKESVLEIKKLTQTEVKNGDLSSKLNDDTLSESLLLMCLFCKLVISKNFVYLKSDLRNVIIFRNHMTIIFQNNKTTFITKKTSEENKKEESEDETYTDKDSEDEDSAL